MVVGASALVVFSVVVVESSMDVKGGDEVTPESSEPLQAAMTSTSVSTIGEIRESRTRRDASGPRVVCGTEIRRSVTTQATCGVAHARSLISRLGWAS